ncbi:hypothetical protein Q502_06215 [Mesotoga sp. Brook.08.YT.4.2.5.2.]|nr:hypothetical protein M388_09950 [Mesotoga sp. Brook.08.YT.4.2.5.4.]RDI93352.1 hypothetical protein Q502_06215 [Mesotoga sp. Brook.08.YT.4.2.5.2.]
MGPLFLKMESVPIFMKEELLLFSKMESVPIFYVGTKNCSSPALPKDGSTLLDEGRRTGLCTLLFLKMESLFLVTKMESVPIFTKER